eukprot:g14492.t1
MPSTPYAASAAATPIASAKRPKRRANQAIPKASPVRRAALGRDASSADANSKGQSDETTTTTTPATPPSDGKEGGGSSAAAGDGASTTPLGKRAEEGGQGGDAGEGGPEAPSPTKARKGSSSATPRTSGLCTDSRSQQQEQPQKEQHEKGRASNVGWAPEGEGNVRGLKGEMGQDQNRHKPKESSIFSPALNQSQEDTRDQAPASTVGAAGAAAAAAAAADGQGGTAVATTAAAAPAPTQTASTSSSTAEPLAKRGRTSCDSSGQDREGGGGDAAEAATSGKKSAGGGTTKAAEEEEAGSADDEDVAPGLAICEVEEGVDGVAEDEEEEDEEEFNPYCFIAHLPPYNTVKHHTPEAPVLPEKRKTRHGKELTLVLDLDETLVHCTVDPIVNPDHRFEVHFNGEEFQVYVRKRPHLDAFLEAVSELFEVVVFTASQQVYAERLLNMIDPQKKFVKYRLYRDACMALEGNYLKDLNVLGRDLSKVAIVDNSPYAYGFQIDNGIPIESWFDDRNDQELLHLLPLLKQLINESETAGGDVRPFIRSIFKTHELVDKARNGDRDVGSALHYPDLTTVGGGSQERGKGEKGKSGAGSTATAFGKGGESTGDKPSATATTTAAGQ